MIKAFEFYKKCASWMEVATQFSLHFPGEKCVTWKTEKRLLETIPLNSFSANLYQNDRNVSDHLILITNDLENVGQGKNLQKY